MLNLLLSLIDHIAQIKLLQDSPLFLSGMFRARNHRTGLPAAVMDDKLTKVSSKLQSAYRGVFLSRCLNFARDFAASGCRSFICKAPVFSGLDQTNRVLIITADKVFPDMRRQDTC